MKSQQTSESELHRYAAQCALNKIGVDGQRRLGKARVAIVGVGAIGSIIADRLVRAGVGFVRLIDRDLVELSNLQRQFLFDEADVSAHLPKAVAAAGKLRAINQSVEIEARDEDLNPRTSDSLLEGLDLIVDGTDNMPARWLLNDYSVAHKVPWIYGGVGTVGGATATVIGESPPCLRCLEEMFRRREKGGSCLTDGVLNTITAIIGSLEATESLRYLVERRFPRQPRFSIMDAWVPELRNYHFEARPDCPCCVHRRFQYLSGEIATDVAALCGDNSFIVTPSTPVDAATSPDVARGLRMLGDATSNEFLLYFRKGDLTVVVHRHGKVMVRGVPDEKSAKGVVSQYFGIAV